MLKPSKMDEISNSGSYEPSSPVMESPLMQLANASVSVMRANLSPKEIKNLGIECKRNPIPALHSTSPSVNTDPHISLLSDSNTDSFARTHVSPEGTVSSMNNPSPEKLVKKPDTTSFVFVGTENPVSENITTPQISKHGNIFPQVTGTNVEFTTEESDSHKEHMRNSLPLDDTNVTKSSVSGILTSNLSESIFTTSDIISAVAAGDAICKRTDNLKDFVSQQTLSSPILPRLNPLSSQINTANSQTENVPVKTSALKLTTSENEKNISLFFSEPISKTSYTAMQSLQSVRLTQKPAKDFANPSSVTTVAQESHKDTNSNPQMKHLSNAPVSNIICSLPSNTPLVLPVTTNSAPTAIVLHSRPLLKLHSIPQSSTTHSLLNKHSHLKESQNISENVTIPSDIISSNNTSVNVPTIHTSSIKLIPSFSQASFPAKSDYSSPCTIAVGTDGSSKKTNLSNTHFSSVNLVSKISSPITKQLSKIDKKDITSCSPSVKAVQAKADVEVTSKHSFQSTNVVYCSFEDVNTVAASKFSLAKNADTNLVSVCTVGSVTFCTSAVNTTTSAVASTVKCNPDSVTHIVSTSTNCSTTFSTSASCTRSISACTPGSGSHISSSLTATTCTPSVASCILSIAPCFPPVTTCTVPITSVPSINMPLTAPCSSSTLMYTSGIATSLTTVTSTSAITTCIPVTTVQSPKKLTVLQEYEIMINKSDVKDSKNITKKHPTSCFQDGNLHTYIKKCHTGMSHFWEGQSSNVPNVDKQKNHLLSTPTMEPLTIVTDSETNDKPQDVSIRSETTSSITETEASSSSLDSSTPDESIVTVIKPSDDKASGCKYPTGQLSKNSLSRIEANMDSSDNQSLSAKITETCVISNTTDCMTTVSSSTDQSVPISDQKFTSASLIGTVVSTSSDNIKKNLQRNKKNISNVSTPVASDKSELVPLSKKSLKKSKLPNKESKSIPVSKTQASTKSTLSSTVSKEEPISSDLSISPSYPKYTSLLKNKLTMSSNEKDKSQISTVKTETTVSTKGSAPIKSEGCNISTRPRRIIKARHLFSSSSYSTGSTKSDASGESSSSSNKQRKKIITQPTDEEKKSTSSNANKKSHVNKTVTDDEVCFPLKKSVRRRILPAVKTDSTDTSKNCLLIKASPNVSQAPSNTSLPPGYTYLLTALSVTTAEKDPVKIVKTPTMASNSGVTSTSPTYSNSKRNVTTKCSTTKEQKSSELTFVETDKTCNDSLISSSRTSSSHKTWNPSPVNYTGNTSDDSLEDANESDTLQNSAESSLSRKRKISSSDLSAGSNSLSATSCEDLSQQIAEAEKFIKKEPIEVTEVDQSVIENSEATSQNSSAVCAPTRDTCEIRKLLNASCSNTQVSLVQDLISPSPGNNLSQTRPLAPVQLSSPYAIFLPVSLASGATTAVTTPPTSAPLYSIQLNVPNVVRMGKPFLPNDGGMSKKHCTIIPAITCPKTDNSSTKSNLISRNNLIATYYPAPLPESLMNKITVNYHACGECGDTFLFKSSLNAHKTRKCMQLTYNCDNCTMKLVFYNKCSVLEHIRSHYPTRPVTIKLDRMEVMPLPEGITDVIEMEDDSKEENSHKNSEETAKFDCTECGAKFHSARALADHFGHSEIVCSFTFYCALCQTYLPRHCAQLAHRRVHHEKPPHVCPECGQLISNLFSFREHLKYKCMHFSRIAPLTCPKCMSKFCYTPELKEHIISVHSETFIKCSICPMAFKASASYQAHHQNTHASEPEQKKEIYKCPLCDTVFHSIQQLMNHVDVHIGELKKGISYAFRCSICFSIFAKRSQLVSHLGSSHHLDYVQHRCEFCDCVCKTAHNLQTHQRAIHKVELKKFELSKSSKMKGESAAAKSKKIKNVDVTHCSLCHIFFATLAQLQMHTMKVHQKKMNDSLTDSGTASELPLSSTLAQKNKNSQKFCRYCKAPYKSWSRLMQHILGHRNSGVYICLICTSAAFVSKEELSKHEEFCSGENLHDKPPAVHECEECHQLFKQESWLIAHQKNIHPKKGAFNCDLCGLPYKSNSSLQKHIQTLHEGKKSFCCYICKELNKEKIFRCQSQLEKHLMTKHKMSLNQMKMKQSNVAESNSKNNSLPEEANGKNNKTASKGQDVVPAKKAKLAIAKEETYICAKCNYTSQNFEIFQLHIQDHKTSEDGIQCSTCGLCFAAVDSLRMHLFAVHKIKRSNDSLRDFGVNKSPNSKTNEDSKPPVIQSPVRSTPLSVTTSESTATVAVELANKTIVLSKHTPDTNSDSNLLSCQCTVCYKTFESEHLLKVHMRTHGMAFIRSKRLAMTECAAPE